MYIKTMLSASIKNKRFRPRFSPILQGTRFLVVNYLPLSNIKTVKEISSTIVETHQPFPSRSDIVNLSQDQSKVSHNKSISAQSEISYISLMYQGNHDTTKE